MDGGYYNPHAILAEETVSVRAGRGTRAAAAAADAHCNPHHRLPPQ